MTNRKPADEGRIEGRILAGTGLDVRVLANDRPFWSTNKGLTERDWAAVDSWLACYDYCQDCAARSRAARKAEHHTRKLDKLAAMLAELRAREGQEGER